MPQGEHHSHAKPPPGDALAVARHLTDAVEGLRYDLDAKFSFLRHYGRVNRVMAVITAVSLVAILALVVLFIGGEIQLRHAQAGIARNSASVAQVHQANVHACQVGNQGRAVQLAVWNKLVALSTKPPAGSETAKRLDVFIRFYRRAYAPRNCQALYPAPGRKAS